MWGIVAAALVALSLTRVAVIASAEDGARSSYFEGEFEVVASRDAGNEFSWLESPLWSEEGQYLLFSDVKWSDSAGNTAGMIWKYDPERGVTEFLPRAGIVGPGTPPSDLASYAEAGPNGMIWGRGGYPTLLLCQHGMQRIVSFSVDEVVNGSIAPDKVTVVASEFNGTKLNSPNDIVLVGDKVLFTDPPFGLQFHNDSGLQQAYARATQPTNVYALSSPFGEGMVPQPVLVDVHRPNGVAVSSAKQVFVARTDSDQPGYSVFDTRDGDPANIVPSSERAFNMTHRIRSEANLGDLPALADGMQAHRDVVFAAGPGGLYVLNGTSGEEVAFARIDDLVSNVEVGGGYVWVTANQRLLRIRLSAATPAKGEDTAAATSAATRRQGRGVPAAGWLRAAVGGLLLARLAAW